MAGLFALLYGLFWVGSNLSEGVQNDIYTNNNKKYAESSGKEIYRDANGIWHWTENNEVVNVVGKPGSTQGYKIVGVKSHTIYHNELSDQEILDKRFQDGIEYCKENGIKYLP